MKKLHYSWIICIALSLLMFLTVGLTSNTFSVYQLYIITQNNFNNFQGSFITTIRWLLSLTAIFFIEKYYQKTNIRMGITIATICVAGSFFIYSTASSMISYCIASAFSGIGYGLGSIIPVSILINRWFKSNRTFAIGLCAAGSGIATVTVPPILTSLIMSFGIKTTFLIEGLFVLLSSIIIYGIVRNDPSSLGMKPYISKKAILKDKINSNEKIGAKNQVLLILALILLGAIASPGFGHLTILYASEGYDSMIIAYGISISGVLLMIGKCLYGQVTDHFGAYKSNAWFGSIWILGQIGCCFSSFNSEKLLFFTMTALGLGLSLSSVGISVWAKDLSGDKTYEKSLKQLQLSYGIGALLFSIMPGILADIFKSYIPAYIIFAIFSITVIAIVQYVYRNSKNSSFSPVKKKFTRKFAH